MLKSEDIVSKSPRSRITRPGVIVLKEEVPGRWIYLGEVDIKPGLTAKKSRSRAVSDVTNGKAKSGESYAVILKSEWKVARTWE